MYLLKALLAPLARAGAIMWMFVVFAGCDSTPFETEGELVRLDTLPDRIVSLYAEAAACVGDPDAHAYQARWYVVPKIVREGGHEPGGLWEEPNVIIIVTEVYRRMVGPVEGEHPSAEWVSYSDRLVRHESVHDILHGMGIEGKNHHAHPAMICEEPGRKNP